MPALKLVYLPVVARAEGIRMLLAHTKTPYEDVVLPFEEHKAAKPDHPFGQLPVLEVDGVKLPQTLAILRYIADLHGMGPTDPLQAAMCQAVAEAMNESEMAIIQPAVNMYDDSKCRAAATDYRASLPKYLNNFQGILGDKDFFHGSTAGYADLFVFAQLNLGMSLAPGMFDDNAHSSMAAWYKRCNALEGVESYLSTRTPPRDRSEAIKDL